MDAPPTSIPASPGALRRALIDAVLTAAALALAAFLVARLSDVFMMAFGAVLVAVVLHAFAGPLSRRTRLGRKTALTVVVVLVLAALGGSVWVFGRAAQDQLANLTDLLPRVWRTLNERFGDSQPGSGVLHQFASQWAGGGWIMGFGQRMAGQVTAAVAATVIVAFAGLYLAYNPGSYLSGALLLLPPRARPRAKAVADRVYESLRQWLLAQFASMLLVGLTTGLGLFLVGVPSAFALGLIAGLGQFVPVVGPLAATVPGLLAAAGLGVDTFIWAAVVYLAGSQFEANLVTPFMLRQMAQLPMALTLFAVLAMGVLFGALGVLFATPLAVVAYVAVQMLYVEPMNGGAPEAPEA
ncbi:MAG: AI-2E family transporter [Caulobacteraceae bacterium]|nr:AI-2E family transporter [Caulobacteraceae bacterium]